MPNHYRSKTKKALPTRTASTSMGKRTKSRVKPSIKLFRNKRDKVKFERLTQPKRSKRKSAPRSR